MAYTREQRQEAYRKLPDEVKSLVMDAETTELVTELLNKAGLTEEQMDLADTEILYSLYCLEPLDTALNNIASACNKSAGEFSDLRKELEEKVFSKYAGFGVNIVKFIEESKKTKPEEPVVITKETKNAVIQELSQRVEAARQGGASIKPPTPQPAQDIHPMIEEGEEVHEAPLMTEAEKVKAIPIDEPVPEIPVKIELVEQKEEEKTEPEATPAPLSTKSPHYPGGKDPYREPFE